jgi:hypothetical protein
MTTTRAWAGRPAVAGPVVAGVVVGVVVGVVDMR